MIATLKNKAAIAEIDTMGAQLVSFQDILGIEYLWQGDPAYWSGQAPILFPIVGALRGGKTCIGGKEYEMKRHGFARGREFRLVAHNDAMAVLSLSADDETRARYPFDFQLLVTYRLDDGALSCSFTVINQGTEEMPFAVGGHPAFNCPLLAREVFTDYVLAFEQNETADCPQIDLATGLIDPAVRTRVLENERILPLEHGLFARDALVFDALRSKKVQYYSKLSGVGLEMDFSGFPYLGVWSAAGDAPFVALEPWTGMATCADEDDEFLHKRGTRLLPAGESFQVGFTVRIL